MKVLVLSDKDQIKNLSVQVEQLKMNLLRLCCCKYDGNIQQINYVGASTITISNQLCMCRHDKKQTVNAVDVCHIQIGQLLLDI